MAAGKKVRNNKDVIDEARKEGKTVHFASLMDICHLKKSEREPNLQTCKGRVILRGDIVNDDSGSYAVFTEQRLECAQVTGKAGETGQNKGELGGSSPWTRPVAPWYGDTLKALAGDQHPI